MTILQELSIMKYVLLFSLLLSTNIWSYTFGIQGRDGQSGRSGALGSDGQSITFYASSDFRTLYLNGEDGSDGTDGYNGSDAYACNQRMGRFNEIGARGGNGGYGGNGGNGGDGGDITIFYQSDDDLKNITVQNKGGVAGRGAYGGSPGQGCFCYQRSWTHRVCRTVSQCRDRRVCDTNGQNCRTQRDCRPVRRCHTEYYSCANGQAGGNGRNGRNGRDGSFGKVNLVKSLNSLPAQNPRATLTIGQLSQSDFVLSKRIWSRRSDGHSRLGNGSVISGQYREFVKLAVHKVGIKWNSNRNIDQFKNFQIAAVFDGHEVAFNMPHGVLIDYELVKNGDSTAIVVNDIFTEDEVKQLEILSTKGYGNSLEVIVKDGFKVSDKVTNKVKLQWVHRKWRIWYVVYDQVVPTEFIDVDSESIKVSVGRVGIGRTYINRGKLIRYTLWIKRSLGNRTIEVKLHQPAMNLR